MTVHPTCSVYHQSASVGCLVIYVQALYAEATFVAPPMLFCHEEAAKRRALAARAIAESCSFIRAATARAMHHIGSGHYPVLPEVPDKEARRARRDAIVYKQRIVLIQVMALGICQCEICPLF